MALSASTVWEVRTTGADTNGGGFVAGASGTDYSQQDAAQLTVTDAACTGNTTVTSATGGFTSQMVGNIMYLSSGPGWYQITARTDTNTITIDRNGPNATGMTAKVGGCFATLNGLAAAWTNVGGNKAFVKAGSGYTSTSSITFSTPGVNAASGAMPNRLIGYTTTRGDGGQATLTLQTNSSLTGMTFSNNGWYIENIHVNCASLSSSIGMQLNGNGNCISNCKISNATLRGIIPNGSSNFSDRLEVTGCGSSCEAGLRFGGSGQNFVTRAYIHDNACPGIQMAAATSVERSLIVNNSGASSDGIRMAGQDSHIINCTIYNNGRHGINGDAASDFWYATVYRNNILANNGGYGIRNPTAGPPAGSWWDGNAFYSNTSGTRSNMDDTSVFPLNNVAPYTNAFDVIITDGSPFTNAAGGDFTLNNTALRGALLRGTALPGAMPTVSQVGYLDFGCFQHQDSGGGSAGARLVGPSALVTPGGAI